MFRFLDRGKEHLKTIDDDDASIVVPGTQITYKKSLISKYHAQHDQLQALFNKALTAYQQGNNEGLLAQLRHLQVNLRKHLLDEELNLYIYLRYCYRGDTQKQELITQFKKSSKKAGTTTFDFIRELTEGRGLIRRDEAFVSRFLDIGNLLETLIAAEEAQLYPIYRISAHATQLPV